MMEKIYKRKTPSSFDVGKEKETKLPRHEREPVPFISHYHDSKGVKYKIGDNKEFGRQPYFFCNYTLHRNHLRWHTHSSDSCHIRARWIKKNQAGSDTASGASVTTNIGKENNAYDTTDQD